MTVKQYDHPKYMLIGVLVDGERFLLRHETDVWFADPLAKFRHSLHDTNVRQFTQDDGQDIYIRPCRISAYTFAPRPEGV